MAKFPEPPPASQLVTISPETRILAVGTRLWRVYFRGGEHPTWWDRFRDYGPTRGRFDHHLPPPQVQSRAISYGALQGPTCLAEVFQDTRVIDRSARDPWLVSFALVAELHLLDLTGIWPTRAGASMALATGSRPRAQRWSRAIYDAYPKIQGVYYPSSMHGNKSAVALYERALNTIPPTPLVHRPLTDPALLPLLKKIARDLGYGLI